MNIKLNRIVGAGIALAITASFIPAAYAADGEYADWNAAAAAAEEGTDYTVSGDTYYINTPEGLAYAASVVNSGDGNINITLNNDIHLENSGVTDYPFDREEKKFENGWIPIGKSSDCAYSGTFDGDGHSIYALYVGTEQARGGLIGVLDGGEVKNLKIKSGEVHGTYAAGIAAEVINSNITSCQSSVYIGGTEYAGGIAAKVTGTPDNNVVIYDTSTSCYVGSDKYGGGIAGYCEYTSIIDCGSGSIAVAADVTISDDVYGNTRNSVGVDALICGGLVGEAAANVNIENCNNANSIYIKNSGTGGGIAGIISADSGNYINNVTNGAVSDGGYVTKGALYGEIENASDLDFDGCYYIAEPDYYPTKHYLEDPCGAGDEGLPEDTFTVYYQWGANFWVYDYNILYPEADDLIITALNQNVTEHNAEPEYEYTAWQNGDYGVGLNKTYTITVHGTSYFIEDAEPTEVVSKTDEYTQNTKGKFEMFLNNLTGTYHYTYGFQLNEYVINQGERSRITVYTCAIFTDMDLYYTIYDETSTPSYCQAVAADEETAAELESKGVNVKDGVYGEENGTTFATGFHYYASPESTSKDNNYLRFFVPQGSYYVDTDGEIKQTDENKWSQMKYQFDTHVTSGSIVFSIVINNLYAPDARMDIAEEASDDPVYNGVVDLNKVGDFYKGSN